VPANAFQNGHVFAIGEHYWCVNHRMFGVGRDLCGSSSATPYENVMERCTAREEDLEEAMSTS